MFKNIKWRELLKSIIIVIISAVTGIGGMTYLNSDNPEPAPVLGTSAAFQATDFANLATDGGVCSSAKYCAIYRIRAFYLQPVTIGGAGKPEYQFQVLTEHEQSVVISNAYTNEKAIAALQSMLPYPGWKVDKVVSKTFVQWIKYPSESGEVPTPEPKEPPVTE